MTVTHDLVFLELRREHDLRVDNVKRFVDRLPQDETQIIGNSSIINVD